MCNCTLHSRVYVESGVKSCEVSRLKRFWASYSRYRDPNYLMHVVLTKWQDKHKSENFKVFFPCMLVPYQYQVLPTGSSYHSSDGA